MANNYSPMTPVGRDNFPKIGYIPTKLALASTNKESAIVSSVLQFTHDTTEIEVSAVGGPIAGKWAVTTNNGTSVIAVTGTANFDFVVSAATTKRFVVPIRVAANYASVQGVNRQEGLYQGVAFINAAGPASVLTAEY